MERLAEITARKSVLLEELDALKKEETILITAAAAAKSASDNKVDEEPAVVIDMAGATAQEVAHGSMSQVGCSAAQEHYEAASPDRRAEVTAAVWDSLALLACDAHATFFVQKVFELCDEAMLSSAMKAFGADFVGVAANTHGARAVQRIMEMLSTDELTLQFFGMVVPNAVPLSQDANGTHVVQRVLGQRFTNDKTPLVDALIANCAVLSMNKQGCCIVQRCFDVVNEAKREELIQAILDNTLVLVQDAFGNYVIQFLLDQKEDSLIKRVILQLLHNVAALSCNKFGSNVVEKCMRMSRPEVKQLLIDELTDPSVLPRLVQDSFANYVMQTAISTADEEQFAQLHNAIRPCFPYLRHSPYGVRIEAKISRRLKDAARQRQRKTRAAQGGPRGGGGGGGGQHQNQHQNPHQLPSPALSLPTATPSFPLGAMQQQQQQQQHQQQQQQHGQQHGQRQGQQGQGQNDPGFVPITYWQPGAFTQFSS
jgi:hypothetical protein